MDGCVNSANYTPVPRSENWHMASDDGGRPATYKPSRFRPASFLIKSEVRPYASVVGVLNLSLWNEGVANSGSGAIERRVVRVGRGDPFHFVGDCIGVRALSEMGQCRSWTARKGAQRCRGDARRGGFSAYRRDNA